MNVFRTIVCLAFFAVVGCAGMDGSDGPPSPEEQARSVLELAVIQLDLQEALGSTVSLGEDVQAELLAEEPDVSELRWECEDGTCCYGCGGYPDPCICCVWIDDECV